GLALPRQTDDQLRRGRHVSTSQLLRGDLLFFDQDGKRASHVGVYLGGGKFVHAPSTGKRVRVDSLDSAYWRRYLSDTRRYAD
ncbi:MAG: C40 family peptidase, partial [Betaproteobacteria bacterium]|nr:C40 family peptidase [Betaproteobacteria bacterium]